MKTESSGVNPYNGLFGQQGWICPKCGRVYSPFTPMCLYCGGGDMTITSNYVRFMRQDMPVNEGKLKEDHRQKPTMTETIEEAANEYAANWEAKHNIHSPELYNLIVGVYKASVEHYLENK